MNSNSKSKSSNSLVLQAKRKVTEIPSHQTKKRAKTAEDIHGRGSSGSTRITSSSTPGGATPQWSPSIVEIDDDKIAKATENSDSECGK
jgi:hypothetical protein